MMFRLHPSLASVCLSALALCTRYKRHIAPMRVIAGLMSALLISITTHAAEPDESGIGGTGHGDVVNGENIFDRPEMPDRIERIEPFERPEQPDFSGAPELPPPSDVGVPGSIPTAPASGSQ